MSAFLNNERSIQKWSVEANSAEKTLSVETTENDSKKIIEAVEKAEFKREMAKNN